MKNKELLLERLRNKGILSAGALVQTSIITNMEIYGFVPFSRDTKFSTDFLNFSLDYTVISSNRLATKNPLNNDYMVHPIYREVATQKDEPETIFPLLQIYIPQFRKNPNYIRYVDRIKGGRIELISELDQVEIVEKKDDNGNSISKEAFYHLNKEELLFQNSSYSSRKAVGEQFCVVCRRLNPISGNIKMEIFNPEELFIIEEDPSE